MSRPRKAQEQVSTDVLRKTLEADVDAFLAAGNKIETIPTGFTNQDPMGGRRHIVLGPRHKG